MSSFFYWTPGTIHHSSLRVVTGAFRTSPTSSLLAEAHEQPLSLRRQMLGARYALKLRQFPDHPTYPYVFSRSLLSLFRDSARKYTPFCSRILDLVERSGVRMSGIMRVGTMAEPPWETICPQIDLSLANIRKGDVTPIESRCRAIEHLSSYEGHTLTFTDGSKTREGVGSAFVCGQDTRSFSVPEHSSVFSSELVAIIKALCFIEVSNEALHLILTDSLSSLLALRAFYPCNPLIQDVLSRLTALDQGGKTVKFCWIPSHVGIAGNELADSAARRAASVPCTRRLPLPARDFYPAIGSYVLSQWQRSWDTLAGNKLRELKPTLRAWPSSLCRRRRDEVTMQTAYRSYVRHARLSSARRGTAYMPTLPGATHSSPHTVGSVGGTAEAVRATLGMSAPAPLSADSSETTQYGSIRAAFFPSSRTSNSP